MVICQDNNRELKQGLTQHLCGTRQKWIPIACCCLSYFVASKAGYQNLRYSMKKSWPPFLNACRMTSAALRCSVCVHIPCCTLQDGAVAVQELVLLLSPFYKQENSASERLGTQAGMAWLIKEHGRDSNPCLWHVTKPVCMNTIFHSAQETKTAVKYEATMFLYATSLAQHISHSAFVT